MNHGVGVKYLRWRGKRIIASLGRSRDPPSALLPPYSLSVIKRVMMVGGDLGSHDSVGSGPGAWSTRMPILWIGLLI